MSTSDHSIRRETSADGAHAAEAVASALGSPETESGLPGGNAVVEAQGAAKVRNLEKTNRRLRAEMLTRAAAEASLQASERKYRGLVQSAIDGIAILQKKVLTYVNPRLCEMVECDAEHLLGTSFEDHLAPEEQERALGLYRRMTFRETFPQLYETVLVSRSGARLDVSVSACLLEVDGHSSVMVVVRDVSGQKRVSRMALENGRLEAVRAVARGVGNNFANTLSLISSYAASITDSFLPNTRTYESAKKILDASRHATELAKHLLEVGRVSGAEDKIQFEPVSIQVAVHKAHERIASTFRERNVRFVFKTGDNDLYVMAGSNQLLDVLVNIFLNGSEAMLQGGDLRVEIKEHEMAETAGASVSSTVEYIAVSVTDAGIGMSADQLTKVFDLFYTTKSDRDAFGLGLPVAQSVVKGWGGWIEISSEPGRGTCVKIIMVKAETPMEQPQEGGLVSQTILVVDDHTVQRSMMVDALRTDGHLVLEAESGDQAISVYKRQAHDIDLVVLDWIMPGVNGKDVFKMIHEHDLESRVLMISGFSKDYVRSQIRMGAWSFLQKPFSVEQFRASVRKALAKPAI